MGATIEWYDFFLDGTAAGLVFDQLFLNGLDGPAAQFAAFGTFAVGFVARPVFNVGATLALLFAFPAAWLVQTGDTWEVAITFTGGLGVVHGIVHGPLAAFWSELFDTRYRYTALSTPYQVSGIVASGFTPLIAAWLVTRAGGTLWLVATYAVAVAAISLVCARLLPETRGRDLTVDEAPSGAEDPQPASPSASRSSSASATISS